VTDWRVENAQHLKRLPLRRQAYKKWTDRWDHEHCAGCMAEFAESDRPDIQRAGYATTADYVHGAQYEWVCIRCFNDLKLELGWTEAS
jgi:hypothetical protein